MRHSLESPFHKFYMDMLKLTENTAYSSEFQVPLSKTGIACILFFSLDCVTQWSSVAGPDTSKANTFPKCLPIIRNYLAVPFLDGTIKNMVIWESRRFANTM